MQTLRKNGELLHTQTNANEPIKENSPLIERYQIPGSPYWIIGDEEKGYNLRFGKYKFTENMDSIQKVEEHYEENRENVILQTILAVTNELTEQILETNKTK